MIIRVDSDRDGYTKLFTDAYNLLLSKEVIQENEAGRLTSLEEFFSYIQDIVQFDERYLIRLPIEEPTLTIDANKRTIDTSLFSKCNTVQSDQIAEIVVFSIDRYYDYKDLADEKVQIWVQWIAPDGSGGTVEGATYIKLKDTETEKGKLRFGWPLDNVITAHPGNVQFAVRFFMKDDVEEYDNTGALTKVNKIVYSLNTLPATLSVKNALQPELNDDVAVNRPDSLFSYAVRNSLYAGPDVAIPQVPSFDAPGSQPPMEATLVDNKLTLMAQAVAGDAGTITYNWYYQGVGQTAPIDCTQENWGTIGTAYRISSAKERILSDDYYSNPNVTTAEAKDVYYSHIDSNTINAFKVYTGKVENQEQADGSFILVDKDGFPLYEKYSTLTVPATGDVTGTYTVKAWNTTTVKTTDKDEDGNFINKTIQSEPRQSRECTLVSPTDINVVDNLDSYALILSEIKDEETVIIPAELKVVLAEKVNDNTVFNYKWYRADSRVAEEEEVANSSINKYSASEPGWYKTYITASLNRQTNEYTTDWCKVTKKPEPPVLTITTPTEDGVSLKDNLMTINKDINDVVTLTLSAIVNKPEGYEAAIGNLKYTEDDLYSEGLSYSWTFQIADGEERPVTEADIVGGDIDSNTIEVKVLGDLASFKPYTYRCTVANHLNNEMATSEVLYQVG